MMLDRMQMLKKAINIIRAEHKRSLIGNEQRYYYRSLDMASALMHLGIISVDKYLLLSDIVYRLYE